MIYGKIRDNLYGDVIEGDARILGIFDLAEWRHEDLWNFRIVGRVWIPEGKQSKASKVGVGVKLKTDKVTQTILKDVQKACYQALNRQMFHMMTIHKDISGDNYQKTIFGRIIIPDVRVPNDFPICSVDDVYVFYDTMPIVKPDEDEVSVFDIDTCPAIHREIDIDLDPHKLGEM